MDSMCLINSKLYWEWRHFDNWDSCNGLGQTLYFAKVMIENIPDSISQEIYESNMSMCDFGCAKGQLCNYWNEVFSSNNTTGFDLSDEAIKQASEMYSHIEFTSRELTEVDSFDCVVTSNTLEHLENYLDHVKLFADVAQKYIIILVPYKGQIFDEHVVSLDENSFPDKIGKFIKTYEKIIQCNDERYWTDKQYLCIYKRIP